MESCTYSSHSKELWNDDAMEGSICHAISFPTANPGLQQHLQGQGQKGDHNTKEIQKGGETAQTSRAGGR